MKAKREFNDMYSFGRPAQFSWPHYFKRSLVSVSCLLLVLATWPRSLPAAPQTQAPPGYPTQAPPTQAPAQSQPPPQGQAPPAPPYAQQTPEQLQQLVAPIALYPDSLVAQILAAATFPEQVVEADRWVQAHPDLKGQALGQAVDQQPWDPSVKALTAFPSVLGNMDKNISWTSSLGDAYYNQQQDVMTAVQVMRQRAEQAGNLKSTPQQTVSNEGPDVVIQPTNPDVVYVPAYDPWLVYGAPIYAWPGWYPYPGIWFGGPYLSFGAGFGIGFFGGFGWGWGHWGFDWGHHYPIFDRGRYFSRSTTFYNRNSFYRGGGVRGGFNAGRGEFRGGAEAGRGFEGGRGVFNAPGATARPFNGNTGAARGYTEPRGQSGMRSGAFNGITRGGEARSYSSRGSSSFGGGGFRGGGGGGGFHGGGGRGGGRR
ncbi:MAG TPA: DUF3300 domain-containing protein [Candidatus Acidoferrales bacterium]|nr:DUF3300 domain-containing protein [Candidatus Acidoferrales bacterium]